VFFEGRTLGVRKKSGEGNLTTGIGDSETDSVSLGGSFFGVVFGGDCGAGIEDAVFWVKREYRKVCWRRRAKLFKGRARLAGDSNPVKGVDSMLRRTTGRFAGRLLCGIPFVYKAGPGSCAGGRFWWKLEGADVVFCVWRNKIDWRTFLGGDGGGGRILILAGFSGSG